MSLRRFMHPRNKYKQEPNFKQLAILYPEFRKIATTDLAGKVRINFQDLESLRVLAKTLLKHDFDLNVEIPPTKLVPAIPSRLNYILWIEDLAKHAKFTDMSSISGIDIGTGAVCIYPLLLAKLYGCKMIGTEVDSESYESAIQNVNCNNFGHLIKVIRVNKDTVLQGSVSENNDYTFTMCNPPFFGTQEASPSKPSRNRLPPRNAPSGSKIELAIEGGETQFISQMLEDSIELKDRIKIYTTMLGKKTSLIFLRNKLKELNLENSTWTEFCQGHTTRWGLAWSFLPKHLLDLTTAPVTRISSSSNKLNPKVKQSLSEIVFPIRDGIAETKELVAILKQWFIELKIRVEELNVNKSEYSCWACQLMMDQDTWSHQRKRKRQMRANHSSSSKKLRLDESSGNISESERFTSSPTDDVNIQTIKGSFLVCNLLVEEIKPNEEQKRLRISIAFESGSGGKNALECFRQYLINKLDLREYLKEYSSVEKKQKKQRARKKHKIT